MINMEKNNKFMDLHFVIRSLVLQKSLRIVEKKKKKKKKKKRYSGKLYTVASQCQKFQMKLHYKPCDEIYHRLDVYKHTQITFSK